MWRVEVERDVKRRVESSRRVRYGVKSAHGIWPVWVRYTVTVGFFCPVQHNVVHSQTKIRKASMSGRQTNFLTTSKLTAPPFSTSKLRH